MDQPKCKVTSNTSEVTPWSPYFAALLKRRQSNAKFFVVFEENGKKHAESTLAKRILRTNHDAK